MFFFAVKALLTGLIVALVTEISKRSTFLASLLVALPTVSILSFIWIYLETKNTAKLVVMSKEIVFLVIPSLLFFILFPILIRRGLGFGWSLLIACASMSAAYLAYDWVLRKLGVY